ncbi:hypothetical protein B0H10DRAFT_1960480, partial [Mycena sp. CBHHK59/15]
MVVGVKSETNSAGHGVAGSQVTESPARTSRRQGQRFRDPPAIFPAIVNLPLKEAARVRIVLHSRGKSPGNSGPLLLLIQEELNRSQNPPVLSCVCCHCETAASCPANGPLYGHYSHKRQLYTVYSGSSDIRRGQWFLPSSRRRRTLAANGALPPCFGKCNVPVGAPASPVPVCKLLVLPRPLQVPPLIPSERAARFAAACSRDNFLPLLGYVSMGLWCMHSWETAEVARGADPPDWRSMITEKTTKVHSAFLSYLEESVVGNWRGTRRSSSGIGTPTCRLSRLPPPTPGPDNEHRDSAAPAVEPAPFPPLPAHSKQKKNETIQAFFARRREGNLKAMAKESSTDRQRRTQRSEHAKKGQVPSKARVFVWEEQDGHYIRQPGGRGNYEDLWSEYNGPRHLREYDPVFGEGYDEAPSDDDDDDDDDAGNHPIFPQNIDMASRLPPKDDSMQVVQTQPREDNTMQVVPTQPRDADTMQVMQTQRLHDIEMESLDYGQPGDEDLGPDMAESDIPVRDLTEASRN